MNRHMSYAVQRTPGFTGEVVQRLLSRGPDKALVKVRLAHGSWARGAAQLIEVSGRRRDITILGAAFVDGRPPEEIEPNTAFLLVEGVSVDSIAAEQLIVQEGDGAAADASIAKDTPTLSISATE